MSQGRGPFVNDTCDRETTLQKMGEKCELLSQSKGMESRRKRRAWGRGSVQQESPRHFPWVPGRRCVIAFPELFRDC